MLNARERLILNMRANGLTVREIGKTLDRSFRTIEVHITSIYAKLGAHNLGSAIQIASTNGLINLSSPFSPTYKSQLAPIRQDPFKRPPPETAGLHTPTKHRNNPTCIPVDQAGINKRAALLKARI